MSSKCPGSRWIWGLELRCEVLAGDKNLEVTGTYMESFGVVGEMENERVPTISRPMLG